jgi:hypothetical protein
MLTSQFRILCAAPQNETNRVIHAPKGAAQAESRVHAPHCQVPFPHSTKTQA